VAETEPIMHKMATNNRVFTQEFYTLKPRRGGLFLSISVPLLLQWPTAGLAGTIFISSESSAIAPDPSIVGCKSYFNCLSVGNRFAHRGLTQPSSSVYSPSPIGTAVAGLIALTLTLKVAEAESLV
jgi:hypothetical protein